MLFSWDESKRQENWDLRKVDLLEAALIFEDPEVIESIDPRNDYGEERIQALGQVERAFYLVVYTWRGQTRHLITAWKVGENGRLDGIKRMRAKALTRATPSDAPEIELNEDFWRNAMIAETAPSRKTSVHLRVDPETFAFFRAGGKGHLTRMASVLKAYARSHGAAPSDQGGR